MGKRGPARKPTQLALLHGDRKDRVNLDAPAAPEGVAEPPPDLSVEVAAVWVYTVAQLEVMGLASPADRDALVCYCEAVVTHRRASVALAQTGIVVRTKRGDVPIRNPLLQVQRDAAALVRVFAREFGLTPSARSDLSSGGGQRDGLGAERLLT